MAKKQKKIPVQKRTGTVALLSLFCAAAGVYAESDGWSYNDVEKSVIHAGESHARIAPVKKGEELEDQSKIGNIKKAEISDNASFRYDPALGKDELKGVVFDNESGVQESASLKISEGASLDVDATKSRDGKTDWSGKSAVGVEFAKDTTVTIEAKDASISVKGDTGATAISASDASTKLGSVEIGSVSAKATDSAKAFAINANDADSVKIGSVSGNIKVADAGTVDLGSMQGNIEAANVKDSISVAEKITGNITATSAKDVGIGEISGDVKIDTIGNSVNIGSLDGNLVSTNVGNSSSESSVANITVKSASNTAREVNIVNLAATATISGDEENVEAAKINVGTAEKKLSVNGKVEVRVDEAKGGLSAELKNADANALYVKSVKGGAEIAGEGNVNIVNAEASETPAIKIGDLNGNFAAGFDVSAETSGAIKGDVEIGSISGNTGIINLDGNLTAGTLGADETSTTSISVSGADKTVDITTANGTTTVNGNGSLEAKVGTSNGNLTVSDYKNATIGEVKDGSKLVLNGSDKDAIADVTKADRVEANALGETTIGSANYVKAADSVDASLSIKGQNVKITDASGEYVVDTKALANEGTVEINKGSIANSIDGFNGNVKANETGTIKVEGAGMTGGLDIGKINGDLTSAENAKISGNVNVGEVNKVDVKGGIAAIEEKENTGNLTIGTANDNVAVSGGVAGNMKVADAKKDVAVDTVGKNLTIDMLNGGTVKADEVTETVKVAGTGTVEVTTAGNVDVATTDGKLTIDGQKVSADGSLSIKNTGVVEGGQVHVGAISGDSTVNGFTGDLTVDSNTGKIDVSTIDGKLTAKNAQGDINVASSATEIEATLNGGDLNVSNAESTATVENVAVSGTGNVAIDNNTGSVDVGALGGKLTAKNAQGDINVATSATEIEATLNGGNINAENATVGSAKIGTAEGAQGNAVIGTNTGSIDLVGTFDGKLTAKNAQGDINVATSATEIEATLNGGNINITNAESTATVGNVAVSGTGNVVIDNNTGSVDVGTLGGKLTAKNAQGDINVSNSVNDVDVVLNGGNLNVTNVAGTAKVVNNAVVSGTGNATIDTAKTIELGGDLTGDITVNTSVETINGGAAGTGKTVDGNVDVAQNTGSITLGNVTGMLKLRDAQGNVDVFQKAGNVDAMLNGGQLTVNEVDEAGSAKVDGQGKAIIGKASSVEANTSNGNLHLDGNILQIEGGSLDVDVANVSKKKEDGGTVVATGALDSVEIKNVNDGTNVSFNDVTKANGGTGNVDITDSKLGNVSASGTVEGDFNVTNVEGKIASTGEIQGTTNITDFTGEASFNTVKDVNVNSADPDNKKGFDGSLTIAQGQGAVTFNADAGTVDINLDGGSVTTGLKPNGDAVVLDKANFSGNGTVNVTVDKLESFDQINDSVVIEKNKLSSDGKLNSQITVNSGEFTITNADSITVDGHNENGGRKLTIEDEITDDVTIGRIGNGDVAVAAENATIGGNLDIGTAEGSVTVGTVNGRTEIDTANGDVTVTKGENVTIADANGNVTLGTAKNVTIGDIAADKLATVGTAGDIDINGNGSLKVDTQAGNITVSNHIGGIDAANATVGNVNAGDATIAGDVKLGTAENVKIDTVEGLVKVDEGKDINVRNADSLDLGTVTSVDAGTVANNVDIDNVGTVGITKVGGQTTIGTATDDVSIKTANGDVTVTKGENVTIADANGNVNLGTAKNVTIGDIAAGMKATVGTAGDIDINGKGSLTVDTQAGDITVSKRLGGIDAANATVGNVNAGDATIAGDVKLGTAENVKVDTVEGLVKVDDGKAIKVATKAGSLDLGTVTSVDAGTVANNVDIDNVGRVDIASVGGQTTIGTATDDVSIKTANDLVKVDNGTNVSVVNGKDVTVGSISGELKVDDGKAITVGTKAGSLDLGIVDSVNAGEIINNVDIDSVGTVNITKVGGKTTIGDIAADKVATVGTAGDIDINGKGSLKVENEAGNITVSNHLGGIDAAAATVGNVNAGNATIAGDVDLGTAKNVKIDTVEGLVKVNEGKDINVRNADSLDLGTVVSVNAGAIANNVDIDNVGRVDIASVGGQTTIGTATDDVSIKTANGDVTVTKGENVTITDANGNVDLGLGDGNSVDNVTIGDIAAGKLATVGTAGDIDINGKGSLTVTGQANNITAGNIEQVSVKTANGDINIVTAEDLTFTTVKGNVNVSSEIKTVNGENVNGDVSIAKNTGNVKLGTVNNLVLSNVAGGDSSVVTKVNNKAEITTTTGNATIETSKQLQAMVDGGTLTATTVSDIANVTVNSGTANVGSAKSLDATVNGGSLNVDSVASSSDATVKANGGNSIFKAIAGKLKALLNGGKVEVAKNTGDVEISGSGDATVKDSTGSLEVATSTADKFVKNTNGGISTKGNLNVAIDKAASANFGTVNGGDIVDMTKIDNLTVSESTGILNVGLEGGQVKGKIVIEKATADVNVGNVANLDVTLRNNANLLAIDNTKVGTARVNGGCDASYYNVGTLTVDRSLDGNLEVRGAVSNSADISNVSGTVAINEVASTATASVKNAGSAIVDKAYGKVEFSDFASGSATVNNATANIEATNVAGGLNIGNVAYVNVTNTNVNVLDGNTVNGKIESASGMTLSNSGTATIGNSGQIVVNGDLNVASEFKFAQTTIGDAVIKANNLSGSGATKTVDNFFDAKFVFSGDDSVMEAAALKGTHNAGSSYIDANIDDMSVSHTYVDVTYKNTDGSKVGYEITKNSYLSDKFAKSDNEKALAEIYDNLVFQDDATKDAESVQKKKNFKALAENGNIGAMLPQAVNHAARMNMDLSNIIHLDTINRTAYTRDMLNRINYLKAKGKLRGRHTDVLSGASSVTVRNINRFASYSGDGNIAGSNDSVYGGLANAEYVFDDSLFAGIGIGGFQAKSNGKDASGKAETQSFALNAYADYLFYDNFDWYFGLTYAYGMNEAERNSGSSMNKGKWDSNLVGAFTGVRYAWKPIADREFYIKPLLGMNVSFLMNPSFTENGDSERLDVDSEDYTSVKSIAGIEASYLLDCGLSVAGRMFYTHEFADNRYDITSSFIGSGYSVNTFRTLGSELKRDSGIFGIGLGYDINTDWRVYLDYAAEVSDDVYHNLNAGVQFKF
ncbi:MAG: hypothetical protein SPF41_03725 [Candidatus Merdousia sp.]|nr:hypothetical protein [Candidatus Merdousia sp.]